MSNEAGSDHRGVDLRVFGKYYREKYYFMSLVMLFFFFSNVVLSRQDDYSYDPTKIPVLVLGASFIENTQTRKTQLLLILKTDGQPVT